MNNQKRIDRAKANLSKASALRTALLSMCASIGCTPEELRKALIWTDTTIKQDGHPSAWPRISENRQCSGSNTPIFDVEVIEVY